VERFGKEFFRALPERPGVYLMCGASEGVLYVGKARNLRKRLSAYRVANPERMSRRMIRLLNQTRRIEWDECNSEEAARYREEFLICVLAPKFNSVGKVWPQRTGSVLSRTGQISPLWAGGRNSVDQLWSRCGNVDPAKPPKGPGICRGV